MRDTSPPSLDPLRFPQRQSVRLAEHDYAGGIYFITICAWKRRPVLSRIARGRICLTTAGRIVEDEWLGTNQIRRDAWVDAFVIMPDHFHGIVGLGGSPADGLDPDDRTHGLDSGSRAHAVRPYPDRAHVVRPYLGQFVAGFKSACTRRYREIAGGAAGSLWQRGYYERIVRNRAALRAIRHYIADNPRRG